MKKLNLRLDDLAVDSFHVGDSASTHAGTVRGRLELTGPPLCAGSIDLCVTSNETCDLSCDGTCGDLSCHDHCETHNNVCSIDTDFGTDCGCSDVMMCFP